VATPSERHLGAPGVVDAQEQHGGYAIVGPPLDHRQCLEPLAGEPFGHEGEEDGDRGPAGELVVAGGEEELDRLGSEDALELVGERLDGGA